MDRTLVNWCTSLKNRRLEILNRRHILKNGRYSSKRNLHPPNQRHIENHWQGEGWILQSDGDSQTDKEIEEIIEQIKIIKISWLVWITLIMYVYVIYLHVFCIS